MYVAAGSTAAVIVLSWLHPPSAIGPRRFVECCTETITQVVPLVGAVAGGGRGDRRDRDQRARRQVHLLINTLSGGLLIPALLLSARFLLVLGMGMPTPAVYIMGAALLAPILRQFNLPEMQVHLFMLFYACLSAITPPVAVANFAAAAIAGVNPMALGPYAVKLAIGGFVVPFFFLFNPGPQPAGQPALHPRLLFRHRVCTVSPRTRCTGCSACATSSRGRCACCSAAAPWRQSCRARDQLGATALGAALLALVYLRGRPAKVDVSA